jgi:hypothetical protein
LNCRLSSFRSADQETCDAEVARWVCDDGITCTVPGAGRPGSRPRSGDVGAWGDLDDEVGVEGSGQTVQNGQERGVVTLALGTV